MLGNDRRHGFKWRDPLLLGTAETWLLREGWMRALANQRQPSAAAIATDASA